MNFIVELLIILLLLFSIIAWRRQRAESFGVEAIAKWDMADWLLICLLLIAAFGFGALFVYILL